MKLNIFGNEKDKDERIRATLAESYSNLVNTAAWKDLDTFLSVLVQESVNIQDTVNIQNLTLAEAARCRGIREAIDKIRRHIEFYVTGEDK